MRRKRSHTPRKPLKIRFLSVQTGCLGKLCNKAVEKPGWCGKPEKPEKNLINGNDKGVLRARETKQNLNRPGIFEKRWTTRVLNFEKSPAG